MFSRSRNLVKITYFDYIIHYILSIKLHYQGTGHFINVSDIKNLPYEHKFKWMLAQSVQFRNEFKD